jgi:hypothetical protein
MPTKANQLSLWTRTLATVSVLGICLHLQAMDRWKALSQIESCDNDRAIGSAGEVSRYQIKPRIWQRYAPPSADWQNPQEALAVVKTAMKARCANFERRFHRPPTDLEFYILWNAPAQVRRPTTVVLKRAKRFCNLVCREEGQSGRLVRDQGNPPTTQPVPNHTNPNTTGPNESRALDKSLAASH